MSEPAVRLTAFEEALIAAIRESGQSLSRIAAMSKVHRVTLTRFVNRKSSMTSESVGKIAEYLGLALVVSGKVALPVVRPEATANSPDQPLVAVPPPPPPSPRTSLPSPPPMHTWDDVSDEAPEIDDEELEGDLDQVPEKDVDKVWKQMLQNREYQEKMRNHTDEIEIKNWIEELEEDGLIRWINPKFLDLMNEPPSPRKDVIMAFLAPMASSVRAQVLDRESNLLDTPDEDLGKLRVIGHMSTDDADLLGQKFNVTPEKDWSSMVEDHINPPGAGPAKAINHD